MNKIWAKNFEGFLVETTEKKLESYRQHDKTFSELRGKWAMLSLRSSELLNLLSAEDQKTLREYQETEMQLCQMEKERIYKQGYVIIRLLRYLGLWEVFS